MADDDKPPAPPPDGKGEVAGPKATTPEPVKAAPGDTAVDDEGKTKNAGSGSAPKPPPGPSSQTAGSPGDAIQAALAKHLSDNKFSLTGLFYIALGLAILYYAKEGLETSHSSFSFVLVVLGTAMTLYGTGTQSAGDLKSDQTSAIKYNAYVAGGAGVLAFIVAFGMLYKSSEMRQAFQLDRKYVVLKIEPGKAGQTRFDDYNTHFTVEGFPVPSALRDGTLYVYVPFVGSHQKIVVRGVFRKSGGIRSSGLVESEQASFNVDFSQGKPVGNSGLDYPVFSKAETLDLRANTSEVRDLTNAPVAPAGAPDAPPVVFPEGG